MKNKHNLIILMLAAFGILAGCSKDFLEVNPKGSLDPVTLATEDGIEAILIGAYSMLDGVASNGFGWEGASSNWVYGSIRGMTGNKGTDSGDQPDINPMQTFSEDATNPYLNIRWRGIFEAISRCNSVIALTQDALDNGNIDQATADDFNKQARALRGWYHFEAWRMWSMVPYVDENTDPKTVQNNTDITPQIIADLTEGLTLDGNMGQIGRFNSTVVQVLLAKVYMQNGDYAAALPLLTSAQGGTKPDGSAIGLAPTYGEIFSIDQRNALEAVYTVQYSVNDGSGGYNGGWGEVLNFPYKSGESPGGCCGFFQPTQEFVNSFRTDAGTGLPLLDGSYNNDPVLNDQGLTPSDPFTEDAGPLDPRLDWSVGRRGIPYLDWGDHTGSDWVRDQTYAGPFSPKKQVYKQSDLGQFTEVGNWTSGWTANGYRMIRFADILLMTAECEIELNQGDLGFGEINQVRARAANPAGFVKEADGTTDAANYVVAEYTSFPDQAYARQALMMERKLELGMEGHRWFDLNRWGNTQTELNRVLTYEKTMPWAGSMYGSATVGPEDVTYPIPQRQIDLSLGNIAQNR